MQRNTMQRRVIILTTVLFLILLLFAASTGVSRVGKTRVDIQAIPQDAMISINGTTSTKGKHYLSPGKYTFSAERSGFETYSIDIEIKDERTYVGLAPEPSSEEGYRWLEEHPEVQSEREGIGGANANQKGEELSQAIPIINSLPFSSVPGPFTIDYGYSQSRKDGIFLLVRNSSPNGRVNALKWIREQGADPTDLEIRYSDFNNPLSPKGDQ